MIEQQIYKKTGIGLETHSKSSALSDAYIDTFLRPFYSPVDLYYLEEEASPGLKCSIPLSDGSLMIGSSVRRKEAAFIHNYLVSKDGVSHIVRSAASLICAPPPNITSVSVLPQLSDMPHADKRMPDIASELAKIHLSKGEYLALLAAMFAAKEQNRHIFIAPSSENNLKEVLALAAGLYTYLPYYLRANIGFCTLYGEIAIRPEVTLYFVPDDRLAGTRETTYIESYNAEKDYLFNLHTRIHSHIADLKEDICGDYLSFVAESLDDGQSLSDFFDFVDDAGENLSHERKLSLRFYDDLAYIYNVSKNEESIGLKSGRVSVIFTELLRAGAKERTFEAFSDFIKIYRRYIKQKGCPIPPEILKRLSLCYDHCPERQKDELYDLFTLDIDNCLKSDENEMVVSHIDAMRASSELFSRIVNKKMAPSNRLIKRYFTYLIEQRRTVHSVMEFADSVFSDMPSLSDNETIQTMLYDKALELYETSGNRFEAVKYLDSKCRDLESRYPANAAMFSSIYHYALKKYMTELNLSDMTLTQLEKYPLSEADAVDEACTVKHKILLAAKEVLALTDDMAMSFIHYDAFGFDNIPSHLSENTREARQAEARLKTELYRFLCQKADAPRRVTYTILYYIFEDKESRVRHDFDSMFSFIDKALTVPPLEFINWYLSSQLFITPIWRGERTVREIGSARPDVSELSRFYEAARTYFLQHGELLAGERTMKKLKKDLDAVSALHPDFRNVTNDFRKVLNSIMRESYSPLRRMAERIIAARNFKFAMALLSLVVVIAAGLFFGRLLSERLDRRGVLPEGTLSGAETVNVSRLSWSAYKLKKNGRYMSAEACLDGLDSTSMLFSFSSDEKLSVSFGSDEGIFINGISISSEVSGQNPAFSVFVTNDRGRRLSVSISDYDTATGSAIYAFSAPMNIRGVTIEAKSAASRGTMAVKEINAYIKNHNHQ